MEALERRTSELEHLVRDVVYMQRQNEIRFAEFVREMKEFKNEMSEFKNEVRRSISQMTKRWGELANKMGTIVEDIVAPNIPTIAMKYFGCDEPEEILIRAYKQKADKSQRREFDTIVVCGDVVILNETKSSPSAEHVKAFTQLVMSGEFYEYYPRLAGKRLIPIFSSLTIREDIVNLLTKKKIYAMAMKGEDMDLLNYEELESPSKG